MSAAGGAACPCSPYGGVTLEQQAHVLSLPKDHTFSASVCRCMGWQDTRQARVCSVSGPRLGQGGGPNRGTCTVSIGFCSYRHIALRRASPAATARFVPGAWGHACHVRSQVRQVPARAQGAHHPPAPDMS